MNFSKRILSNSFLRLLDLEAAAAALETKVFNLVLQLEMDFLAVTSCNGKEEKFHESYFMVFSLQ